MFWPSTQPSCRIDSQNGFVETDFASSCGLGTGPMPRIPTRAIFSDFCASGATGAKNRLEVRATASPISRMGHLGGGRLPGSLAERHDAHQHGAYARRFQRDEEQAAEAVSHDRRARGLARAIRLCDPPGSESSAESSAPAPYTPPTTLLLQ